MAVRTIALTGGPCSGKTSAGDLLIEGLVAHGVRPMILSEAATEVFRGGYYDIGRIATENRQLYREAQYEILAESVDKLRKARARAEFFPGQPVAIVADRGVHDNKVYMSAGEFDWALRRSSLSEAEAYGLYDGVVHLRSVAVDRPDLYTNENNLRRRESVKEAVAADSATEAAWIGHPHFRIVGNRGDFAAKCRAVLTETMVVLGLPKPLEIERKYRLSTMPDLFAAGITVRTAQIEQYYLYDGARARRWSLDGIHLYFHTMKRPLGNGISEEDERRIDADQYRDLVSQADPTRARIRKLRHYFVWRNQYFELDEFASHNLVMMELELTEANQEVELPPFVLGAQDVTGDAAYSNANLALTAA